MADEKKLPIRKMLTSLAENKKYRTILVVVGLGLIGIIFLSGFFEKKPAESEAQETLAAVDQTVDDYAAQLEANLTTMISRIKDVGEVQVMVTIEKGVENIYATEQKTSKQVTNDKSSDTDTKNQENDNTETTYILVKDSDGGQKAIAVTQIQPVVKGVVVVCDGGDNVAVEQQIINAVTTALDISSAKVCVVSSK